MSIRRNRSLIACLVFALLMICVLFSSIVIFSYVSLCVYIAYWLSIYRFNKTFFVKYLAFIFAAIATVAGAAIIELLPEIYLPELRCQSHFSGSLPLLILSYWIFIYVLEIREYRYGRILKIQVDFLRKNRARKVIGGLSAASGMVLLVLFLYVVTYTLPASLLGIDRFGFATTYDMPWMIAKIRDYSYLLIVFPILALVYANRLIAVASIVLYCAYNLWIGEKFGAFFTLLCIFFIVFYGKIVSMNQRKLKRILWRGLIVFLTLIVLASLIISNLNGITPYDYFFQRTAQQGQLWWKTYDLYRGKTHASEFSNEMDAFFAGDKSNQESVGAKNGIYKVMYLCAPASLVSARLAGGSRYTQADYAVMYYYFGAFGVIIYSILMGIIVSSIVNSFILALREKEYIKAMIYIRFFMMIRTAFSMFTFGGFISTISILSYLYIGLTHGRRFRFGFHRKAEIQVDRGMVNG